MIFQTLKNIHSSLSKLAPIGVLMLFFIGNIQTSKADHVMGADMTYRCMGNDKYKIIVKFYRDCRGAGAPASWSSLYWYAGNNGSMNTSTYSLALSFVGIKDITPRCSTANSPCKPTNTSYTGEGVEEHTYEATVDLTKSPFNSSAVGLGTTNCELTFAYNQCCRNAAITTGATWADFWTTATLNICNLRKMANKCNNSPSLTNVPIAYACCNESYYFNNGALDTLDFDSLSYKMTPALKAVPSTSVPYTSPFTYLYPLTPFCVPPTTIKCTPNPNANPPRGFFLDTTNGDLVFTPVKCDEVAVLVERMTDWRKDTAGVWRWVGRTHRDLQIVVKDNCGYNHPPKISGSSNNKVCEGNEICFTIDGTDETFSPNQTIPDTVQMTWNGGIAGATFTIKDKKKREKQAEFCWKTQIGQASDVAYSFTVTATDDHCPTPSQAIKGFRVKVNPKAADDRKYTAVQYSVLKGYKGASLSPNFLKCGRFAMTAVLPLSFKGNATYQWSVRDSLAKKEFYFSSKKSDTITFKKGGKYIIVHTVNNSYNCPTIYRDTIIVPEPPTVVMANKDTFACFATTLNIKPKVLYAKPVYKFSWSRLSYDTALKIFKNEVHLPQDTLDNLSIPNVNRDSAIRIKVIDGDGCVFYDTMAIYVKPLPVIGLGPDKRICTYETATFDAQNNDTVKYLWNSGDTTQKITKHVKGDYIVKVTDKTYKCMMLDTVTLFVNDTVTAIAGPDVTICNLNSVLLSAQHKPNNLTGNYTWKDISKNTILGNNMGYTVSPKNTNTPGGSAQYFSYSLYTTVKQSNYTCEDYDTMVVKVNTLPFVKWDPKPLKAQCFAYGDLELNSFFNRGKVASVRIWSGQRYLKDIYVDSITPIRHMFKSSKLNNAQLQNGKSYSANIYGWFKDTNGCINVDSVVQKINGNPILALTNKVYCQDKGDAFMDSSVLKPKTKAGVNFQWTNLTVPNGVDSAKVLINNNPLGTPDWHFLFGNVTEDFYMGDYSFKLCIEDILTKCKSCDTTKIKVIGEPTIKIISPNPLCINWDTIDLYDNVQVNGLKGSDGDGGTFKIVEFDYSKSGPMIGKALPLGHLFPPSFGKGNYKILYSNNGTGCLKEDSFYITVNDTPDAVLLSPVTLCSSGQPLDLTTRLDVNKSKPAGANQTWIGANLSGTKYTPLTTKSANIEGPNKFILAYTDNNGCADTETYNVFVRTQPEINIPQKPLDACEGAPLSISAVSKFSNNTVFWTKLSGSDGTIDNVNAENIKYSNGPNDAIKKEANLLVTTVPLANDVCPPVSDSIKLIYYLFPKLNPIDNFKGCVPLITNWNVTETKGINAADLAYQWIFGNGDSSKLASPTNIVYSIQNKYSVSVVVTNTKGNCKDTSIGSAEAYPIPDAKFNTDPKYHTTVALPKFIMYNQSTVAQNPFNPTMGYQWDFGTTKPDTSMMKSPRFAYSRDTGKYLIKLLVTTNHGCWDTASQWVHIGPDIIVFVPDVFTPNLDGPRENETFFPVATNYKSIKMNIYNRWGEKIFETDNINKGWDGNFKNEPCMQDVYVYHIVVTSYEDIEYYYDGTLTLIR